MKKLSLEEITQEEELHAKRIEQESQPKERFVKLTFLIATEGTQTEPNYFNALKAELEKLNRFNIDISVQGKGKSTTALVGKVYRQIKFNNQEYDRVWVVFDRDEFPDFDTKSIAPGQMKVLNFGYCCISKMFLNIRVAKNFAIC